jgi:RimJ/RimL family protein N-acetyltransferase
VISTSWNLRRARWHRRASLPFVALVALGLIVRHAGRHGPSTDVELIGVLLITTGVVAASALLLAGLLADTRAQIASPTIVLRPLRARDADAVLATVDDRVRDENRFGHDFDDAFRRALRVTGLPTHLAICLPASPTAIVGIVTTNTDPSFRSRVEMGIWVGAEHRGHGHATAALRELADHLHAHGIDQVGAETAMSNAAMRTALERAGFVVEGHRRRRFAADDVIDSTLWCHVAD